MRYRSAMLLATTALMPIGVPVAANSAPGPGPQLQVGSSNFSANRGGSSGAGFSVSGGRVHIGNSLSGKHSLAIGRFNAGVVGNRPSLRANGGMTATTGGFAGLVAPGARQSTTLTATMGTVGQSSRGSGFSLDFYGDKLITLGVTHAVGSKLFDGASGQSLSSVASQMGRHHGNHQVELTAAETKVVVDSVVKTSGMVEANSITQHNGMVRLGPASGTSTTFASNASSKFKPAGALASSSTGTGKGSGSTWSKHNSNGDSATTVASLPRAPHVVSGDVTISVSGTTVTIDQTSSSAIINWGAFNIPAGDHVVIDMPSASAVEVDRVTGGLGASQIMGSLVSNGTVFLVNPNGILFAPGSTVNVAGFVASTYGISKTNLLAGNYNFNVPGNPSASIVNMGAITASPGGFLALVAPGVSNSGTLTARLGTVALAASGSGFSLGADKRVALAANDSVSSQVDNVATGQPLSALVSNTGTIKADGGTVQLTAAAANVDVASVINAAGVIEANSVGSSNGTVIISAATAATKPDGAPVQTVDVSGVISAAGKDAATTGGTVQINGEAIALTGATIDVSGAAGGGTVQIGGKGTPATATNITADAATVINASATQNGNGGRVVVWADQLTTFAGQIAARGGPTAGNGGTVETSGGSVNFTNIVVDTSAPNGNTGTWLIDPTNLTIDALAAATIEVATRNHKRYRADEC